MTLTLYFIVIFSVVLIASSFFWYGHTSDKKYIYDKGFNDGYKQGRREVNKHIDSYLRMGGRKV